MELLAFAPNHEGLDNYIDALRLLKERGFQVEVAHRVSDRLTADALARAGLVGVALPDAVMRSDADGVLAEFVQTKVAANPDVFFHCDGQAPVTGGVTKLLREHGYQGLIIGGQGNAASSPGDELNSDRLLCFGNRQLDRLDSRQRESGQACGLPRLDRLRGLTTSRGGYGLFLAHRSPEAPIITATLAAYEQNCRLPIIVCDHPDHPGLYRHKPGVPLPTMFADGRTRSATELMQHCTFVLATDATAAIEAMYLGKMVVLLPNAGLAAFDHYPGISEGFSSGAINEAVRRLAAHPGRVSQFLAEFVGGVRYNHAETVCTALLRLVASGPLRKIDAPAGASEPLGGRRNRLPRLETRSGLAAFLPSGGKAAELGVAKGVFSDELLRERDDFQLYSIDRWGGDRGHDNEEYAEACARLASHGARSIVLQKSFDEALADFAPGSLDLIYLDGYAHDGQLGGRTLDTWWSRLKVGGIFAGHDYHPDWKPTVEAVDKFCSQHGLLLQTTSGDFFPSWYVRKTKE